MNLKGIKQALYSLYGLRLTYLQFWITEINAGNICWTIFALFIVKVKEMYYGFAKRKKSNCNKFCYLLYLLCNTKPKNNELYLWKL